MATQVFDATHAESVQVARVTLGVSLHFGQHVAREELALGSMLLSVAYVHELLGRHDDLFEEVV